MERQMQRLVQGDFSTRIKVLEEADDGLLTEIISKINTLKEDMHTIEERYELNALNHAYNNVIKRLLNTQTPLAVKVKILKGRYAPYFLHKLLKLKKTSRRKRRECPYPGCIKFGLLQLHNHLRQVHKLEDKKERQYWLNVARCGYKNEDKSVVCHLDARQQGENNNGAETTNIEKTNCNRKKAEKNCSGEKTNAEESVGKKVENAGATQKRESGDGL